MDPRFTLVAAVAAGLLLSACGAIQRGDREERSGVANDNGGLVLSGPSLADGKGDLLAAMQGKVPNFRVRRVKERCPQITLRNAVSFQSIVNPHVYVDGARSTDTCILESLQTNDVDRVEVYPTGVTSRPGYGRHSHGLILVFMRDGTSTGD